MTDSRLHLNGVTDRFVISRGAYESAPRERAVAGMDKKDKGGSSGY